MEIVFIGLALSVCCFASGGMVKPCGGAGAAVPCSESSQTPRCGSG